MAASKDPEDITSGDEESETKDEPTRAELKSMLVDIQISISSILLENKQTRKEMAQLKETVLEQKAEIASLKATLDSIKKQCCAKIGRSPRSACSLPRHRNQS